MGPAGNIVLRFTEDNVNLSIVKKSGSNFNILKSRDFELSETFDVNGALTYTDRSESSFKEFIKEEKITGKKVKVIIAQDGIITRLVQSPILSKKDLDKFISNNIEEYFTLNIQEYDYDYTIVNEEKGEVKKFTILLVLFPKNKLKAIVNYINNYDLNIDTINIYPVCIENVFYAEKDKSVAVFDISEDRTNITILEKGTIFLYSRTNSEIDEHHSDYDEILDSLLYFLNFYSTRHFGNRVDRIYITGKFWNNQSFQDALKEQTPVSVISGIKMPKIRIEAKEGIDKNLYADVIGALTEIKRKYNKDINFASLHRTKEKKATNLPIIAAAILMLAVTIAWPAAYMLTKGSRLKNYDTAALMKEKFKLQETAESYDALKEIENRLNKKEASSKLLEGMKMDFTPYVNALRKVLPTDSYIRSFHIDPVNVRLSFVVNGTIDKVVLAESINNSKIFKKIDIAAIMLDDSEKEAQFDLIIEQPLKEE